MAFSMFPYTSLAYLFLILNYTYSWQISPSKNQNLEQSCLCNKNRRQFLQQVPLLLLTTTTTTANATLMAQNDDMKIFSSSDPLPKELALKRFRLAVDDLNYLITNYNKIAEEGGDGVRRYLGTVGTSSGLYGITRVLKELQEEADDIVEYTENMNEFDAYLRQADTNCYSANFVEFSAAKTKPEEFLNNALAAAKQMNVHLKAMEKELKFE